MPNELTSEEITLLVAKARIAKMNGFATVNCRFADYKIVAVRVELDTHMDAIKNLYKNNLTVIMGTSSICG
jgi:hypothetical protein